MTVFVHLGVHKTGSTLLQNTLLENKDILAAHGTFYQRGPGRHPFWHFFRDGREEKFAIGCANLRQRFVENASAYRDVIFSSETIFGTSDLAGCERLYPNAPWALDALKEILDGLDAKIILYVRRQDNFIESTFLNRIQTLATSINLDHAALAQDDSWADFGHYFRSFDHRKLSWLQLVQDISSRFGRENVIVRPFESIKRGKQEYCRSFFSDFSEPSDLNLSVEVYENRSFSEKALREFLKVAKESEYKDLKRHRLDLQARYPSPEYPKIAMLSDEQRAEIIEAHAPENDKLFSDFITDEFAEFRYG